ncbi:hypothetical protein CCH79_00016007 [Gambusia affinis]|uniref:Uncharacterized protein n=1 Tax=Gambusia affinis TaxID=33528 RepID=A0A315VPN2_GAMAF|nr:hypothetical protein CCH79_00016007 [Gambusia affinis]
MTFCGFASLWEEIASVRARHKNPSAPLSDTPRCCGGPLAVLLPRRNSHCGVHAEGCRHRRGAHAPKENTASAGGANKPARCSWRDRNGAREINAPQLQPGLSSFAFVVTHKPICIPNEIAMGLHVSGNGADYSLCESISGAKSSNAIRVSSVHEDTSLCRGRRAKGIGWLHRHQQRGAQSNRCTDIRIFKNMFAKFKGLFSGPQVPADSGTTIASPAPAPAPAPPPAPAKEEKPNEKENEAKKEEQPQVSSVSSAHRRLSCVCVKSLEVISYNKPSNRDRCTSNDATAGDLCDPRSNE